MILLTKRSGDKFLVNHQQIECIEMIPESKIVMMNHDYYLVMEDVDEIIDKISKKIPPIIELIINFIIILNGKEISFKTRTNTPIAIINDTILIFLFV